MTAPTHPQLRAAVITVRRTYEVRAERRFKVLVPTDMDDEAAASMFSRSRAALDIDWYDARRRGAARQEGPDELTVEGLAGRFAPEQVSRGGQFSNARREHLYFEQATPEWLELNGQRWCCVAMGGSEAAAMLRADCPLPSRVGRTWPPFGDLPALLREEGPGVFRAALERGTVQGHPGMFDARFAPVLQAGQVWSDGKDAVCPAVVKRDGEAIAVVMPVRYQSGGEVDHLGRPVTASLQADTIEIELVAKP